MSSTRLAILLFCGCLIGATAFGVRSVFGLFNIPVSLELGWDRSVFALAIAVQNLVWGMGQPFAGRIVDRFGALPVFLVAGLLYAAGLFTMSASYSALAMNLSAGVLIGLGMSGASFTTVLAVFARVVPAKHRGKALGLGTAAGSFGQFLYAPIGQALLEDMGWRGAIFTLGLIVMGISLLAFAFYGKLQRSSPPPTPLDVELGETAQELEKRTPADASAMAIVRAAFEHRSYVLLVTGFFVCGFQLAFITVHWPSYLVIRGADPGIAGWALALIGLFNIAGALGAGMLIQVVSRPLILSVIYTLRAFTLVALVLLPVGTLETLIIASALGLLWLSTVPPTSDLVGVMFGTKNFGLLFGIVFFSHQVGSFLGVWLGGWAFDVTGSYDAVWWAAIILSLLSAAIHMPIKENRAPSYEEA